MGKDKLKRIDIKLFIIPFVALSLGFASLSYFTAVNRINAHYSFLEEMTINVADSYSQSFEKSGKAHDIITELLEEKLLIASQAIMLIENKESNQILRDIAEKFNIDEIYLYNDNGEVIYSTYEPYVGWKAFDGHPVYDFMVSDQNILIEEIRPDSESGIYYKFGYVKNGDGHFVQIGVLAEHIHDFLDSFEISNVVDEISGSQNTHFVFFIDSEYEIVASNLPDAVGYRIEDPEARENISNNNSDIVRGNIENIDVYQVAVPIYSDEKYIATLAIAWPARDIDNAIREIVVNGIVIFVVVVIILGLVLFYAFQKNRANIKIAYYDKLTGLPNKEYLEEFLQKAIANSSKKKKAVLLLNCTNFKTLNMTYGFSYGDQILKQIAEKVKQLFDSDKMFFRFSADRFVTLIEDYEDKFELKQTAQALVKVFENPFDGGNHHQFVSAEVAIVEIKNENITVDKVLQDATMALDRDYEKPNGAVIFYSDSMEHSIKRKDKIEKALRAIGKGELSEALYLEFQPKLDLQTNKIVGFEALARLNHPELGRISPLEFIAIAEEKMLIFDLGNQILSRACQFVAKLRVQNIENVSLAINISGGQLLREEFVATIKERIKLSKNDTISIEIEITESVLFANFNLINSKMDEIRKMGIKISLDDFGTGFSSFSRLRELNVDSLKIDKSFIDKIGHLREDGLITADLISMAHKIGLTVVAEGVEQEEQLDYLKAHDCDVIQGFLISKPLSAEDAIAFLKNYGEK